jgi:DSBA-like thioredoxin domain
VKLTVYGDFNCPLSYLASARVDVILERGLATVDWRAVEHDRSIPTGGRRLVDELREALDHQISDVRARLRPSESLSLRVPNFRPNTAAATAAYAQAPADAADVARRKLFRAVWAEGRNVSDPSAVARITQISVAGESDRVAYWRRCWLGLERPVVPILILHTGYVARGSVALASLGRLAFAASLPYRPWAVFRAEVLSGSRLEHLGGTRDQFDDGR